jgi:hypothetical protein
MGRGFGIQGKERVRVYQITATAATTNIAPVAANVLAILSRYFITPLVAILVGFRV